ncbi:MAG: hypothetical protein ACOZF2_12445 [Thermodesulfobacteriota bacterium]
MDSYRILWSEAEMPQEWYNIQPDLPRPLPPYLENKLEDFDYSEELLKKALEDLPQIPK